MMMSLSPISLNFTISLQVMVAAKVDELMLVKSQVGEIKDLH